MARYFMHKATLVAARDLMTGDIRTGVIDFRFRIDVEDEAGEIIYTLPFKHAINIIPELPEAA